MDSERTHIVRLSSRAHSSAVAPLALARLPKKSVSEPLMLSPRQRVSVSHRSLAHSPKAPFLSTDLLFGVPRFFSRLAVLFLVPMLLLHPLMPVYAADETVASSSEAAGGESKAGESAPVESTPSVDSSLLALSVAAIPDESIAETQPATNPEPSSGASSDVSSSEESQQGETAPPSPEESSSLLGTPTPSDPPPSSVGSTGSSEEETIVSTPGSTEASTTDETLPAASSTDAQVSPSTDETASSSSDRLSSDEAASSTDEVTAEDVSSTETVHQETPEEIVSRLLAEREGVLRNQLRKEVESEFTKGCVTMDAVGYYCLKEGATPALSLAPSEVVSSVSVARGSTVPYNQVSMTKGGVTTEITHDPWDSAFPATDLSGRSIVWQGNVNDRWQIFFADASGTGTPEVVQVTHAAESNFNPRVEGATIVWQGWVDGNWEIYRATHLDPSSYPSEETPLSPEHVRLGVDRTWTLDRLTENNTHDMFPAIAGGLITWQSFQEGTWQVFAYNDKTKTTIRLSGEGVKSENPRFSITWDERGEDGKVRLMGYDIATGKVVDITSEARQLPDDTKPYQPQAPVSQPNQAALPSASSTATSTSSRTDDGDGGTDLDL